MSITIGENELFENMINKIDKIKEILINIQKYTNITDTIKQKEYIIKLSDFSNHLCKLLSLSDDLYDEYILQVDEKLLNNNDINDQKRIKINKQINDVFLPIMLYCQTILQNQN